ncbi:MAG TPA: NADH-quinone oxidoreductase subunit E [Bacteroidales bacterium]|nr:NADH-quinone oxidoreductase subunit E [Bacteroidales bacterium]
MDVTTILKKYPKRRDSVIEILHEIQNHDPQNYLSEESLKKVATHINLPLAQIYGIVGYYSMLSLNPRKKFVIQVCKSPICGMLGSQSIYDAVKVKISARPDSANLFTIEKVECLGQCNQSPCMMINKEIYGNLTPQKIESIIEEIVISEQNAQK